MTTAMPRWCFRCSLVAAAVLVLAAALQWSIIDIITPFLMFPLFAALWLALGGCFLWGVIDLVRHRHAGWRAARPLIVCLVTVVIMAVVPFTDLWLEANFQLLRGAREKIVRQVQARELSRNVEHNWHLIELDSRLPLSAGGNQIVVEEHDGGTYVFFYTYRGILDSYSGFLYVPTGADPRRFSDLGETSGSLSPMGPNWYFASHG